MFLGAETTAWIDHLNSVSDAINHKPAILVIPFSDTEVAVGTDAFGEDTGYSTYPRPNAVSVPDALFTEYAGVLWNLADVSKFRPLSTYES